MPWIGGKGRLADKLLPLIAATPHTCYCEPFAGASALFFRRPERSKVEVLNDINGDLVTLYRVVQHHLDEFVKQFRWALSSRQIYQWAQLTDVRTLTDIQRAARFFFLQKLAFGSKVAGQNFGTATLTPARFNLLRIEEDLSDAHLRLNGVYIEHEPWDKCVRRYDRPHTLFFMDPPYWGTADYGVPFGIEQYRLMADLMRTMQGFAIVTVNDAPEMLDAFAGFPTDRLSIQYTVGRAKSRGKQSCELVIRNRLP